MDLYIETLDLLQCLLETASAKGPTIIVGDMNTTLPQMETLSPYWYKKSQFSYRSALLHDFLLANDLIVANYCYHQHFNYTYQKGNSVSYIDHIFVPDWFIDRITNCVILHNNGNNVSDHFAVQCDISITTEQVKESHNSQGNKSFPKINWDDPEIQQIYSEAMMEKMNAIKLEDPATLSKSEALQYVNDLSNILCSAMHECASKCMAKKPPDKGKHKKWWWNDACTSTRNRNRLYHHIWKSLNRPTSGEVYKCYKASIKAYRKACRDAVNCQYKNKYKLMDRLFEEKRNGQFWNLIRKSKQQCLSTSAINIETLEIYFKDKFKKSEIVNEYRLQLKR